MTAGPTTGFVAIGRPTFDIDSAGPVVAEAFDDLRALDPSVVGDEVIRTSADQVEAAVRHWPESVTTRVVAFATFADSTVPAAALPQPSQDCGHRVVLWSFPEPRLDERLAWNSLCGSILATYRFRHESVDVDGLHGAPGRPATTERLVDALGRPAPGPTGRPVEPAFEQPADLGERVDRIAATMAQARIGVVGSPPDGFEPCELIVEPSPIGTRFEHIELGELFATAERSPAGETPVALRPELEHLRGIGSREPAALQPSLRLHDALRRLAYERRWDAVAVRCWPECLTSWGGAVCAPLSLLSDAGLPSACEADAYGALTCLLLERIGGRAPFIADLVDVDRELNTGDFWHCGMAPRSMADPTRPMAAIDHPNRGVPLALHFGLAAGPMTIGRISQSGGRLRLVVGLGEALDRPPPFLGTSGTLRFRTPVDELLRRVRDEGLEHHFILAPGDHRAVLGAVAERWGLPLLSIAA